MATTINQRFKSCETCRETGWYEFDGYMDGSSNPLPAPVEMRITLTAGDQFPPIRNPWKACFWRISEDTRDDDPLEAADAGFHE